MGPSPIGSLEEGYARVVRRRNGRRTMISQDSRAQFEKLCESALRFVITTHINPDGDAIGSEMGIAMFLLSKGKQVSVVNQDPTPATLAFIENRLAPVQVYEPERHDAMLGEADLIVLVDNSAPDRLGRMERVMRENGGHTLCIDHHPAREVPWAHNIVDVGSSATAAMVFELTRDSGFEPDAETAQALYTGLATDTGFFRFNSTSPHAHRIAAELLGAGASAPRVYEEIYERNSVSFARVLGHALAGLRMDADGGVASVRITGELLRSLDAEDVDTSEITTALLAIDGVRVVVLFRELPDERIKVSLRSKGRLDVHVLAAEFGGGGHRNASGIVLPGVLEEIAEKITARAIRLAGPDIDSGE